MTESPGKPPSPAEPAGAERAPRLAAALRENLRRRKAQSRGRADPPPPAEPAPPKPRD
ncbi:hypothetical protein [Teichococcus aerofrigidensis]